MAMSHPLGASHASGRSITRNVMLIGTTGAGKTTISNMLTNDGVEKEDCEHPGTLGHGADAGTRKVTFYPAPHRSLLICDTVGLGDKKMSNEEIIASLKTTFQLQELGLDRIIVVSKMGRWSAEERINMQLLDDVFGSGWAKQATLVLTNYDGELEDSRRELEEWYKRDEEVEKRVSSFQQVILTDHCIKPRKEADSKPFRENCLAQLNKVIFSPSAPSSRVAVQPLAPEFETTTERVHVPDPPTDTVFRRVKAWLKRCRDYWLGEDVKYHEVTREVSREKEKLLFQEPCSDCRQEIEFGDLKMTECRHSFHRRCWERKVRLHVRGRTYNCPTCEEQGSVLYDV